MAKLQIHKGSGEAQRTLPKNNFSGEVDVGKPQEGLTQSLVIVRVRNSILEIECRSV